MEENELLIRASKYEERSKKIATQDRYIFIGILTILLVYFNYTLQLGDSKFDWVVTWEYAASPPVSEPLTPEQEERMESVEKRMLRRYLVKNLACTYRQQLYAMAADKNNTIEDLLDFHRLIEGLSVEPGGEPKDPVFSLRHADSQKVKKDFLICLPPKAGTSNWQIALAKLSKTKEEMAAKGVVLEDDSNKNVFYPAALYGFVPRFHTVKHAALLQGKEKRYINTRDPFTRARSGWRDKIQYYPEDPAHEANNRQFNSYIEKARKEPGPPAPPKFKVSLEKWLRMLVHDTNDAAMNQHWKAQDECCHFCAMDYEYIIHGRRSEEEWPWVLDKQGLTGILELAPRYGGPDPDSGWFHHEAQGFVEIPIDLIKELYRRYYFDFVAGGYSPQFVEKFISAVEEAQNNLR
ncbi:Oidioi.mRNA.OKI2018_I69.PAR.g8520.t1.cds [Oikopleura dioica]|uniref:Carbohydrate sulfotransferase n=1 Tax=Oikopleura dioica TaxID=34765 RepID=A0ABN7RKE7_OIKDI|nr:Oidioi.mRNA.OKI2018_I69.PAR.g8520.t1.cds [Oikopleura dioica]